MGWKIFSFRKIDYNGIYSIYNDIYTIIAIVATKQIKK